MTYNTVRTQFPYAPNLNEEGLHKLEQGLNISQTIAKNWLLFQKKRRKKNSILFKQISAGNHANICKVYISTLSNKINRQKNQHFVSGS